MNSRGVTALAAGVLGEVLGGHYGLGMLLHGRAKMTTVLRGLLGWKPDADVEAHLDRGWERVERLLRPVWQRRPYYLTEDYWLGGAQAREDGVADVHASLNAIRSRGIESPLQALEVYITETRGAQYICAQLMCCRSHVEVVLPFGDRELLEASYSVPLSGRLHNLLNRTMLRRNAPELLIPPLAATFAPAGSPLLVQESGRFVRHTLERLLWSLHFRSSGRVPRPRFSWVDFQWLRYSDLLARLVERLRLDIWDRDALHRRIKDLRSGGWPHPAHPMLDILLRITTVDLTVSEASHAFGSAQA